MPPCVVYKDRHNEHTCDVFATGGDTLDADVRLFVRRTWGVLIRRRQKATSKSSSKTNRGGCELLNK